VSTPLTFVAKLVGGRGAGFHLVERRFPRLVALCGESRLESAWHLSVGAATCPRCIAARQRALANEATVTAEKDRSVKLADLTEQQRNLLALIATSPTGRVVKGYSAPVARRLVAQGLAFVPDGHKHLFISTAAGRDLVTLVRVA
jgi:hypothetical protein